MSSSSATLMARYLDPESRRHLVVSLAGEISSDPQALPALVALVQDVDPGVFDVVYHVLYQYSVGVTDSGEVESLADVCNLVSKLPRLRDAWFEHVIVFLTKYIHQNPLDVSKEYHQVVAKHRLLETAPESETNKDQVEIEVEVSRDTLIATLKLIEKVLEALGSESSYLNQALDNVLLVLLGSQESVISATCSKLLRWRMNQIISERSSSSIVWDIINLLEEIPYKASKNHAYIFWLRYLNINSNHLKQLESFQDRLVTAKYWEVLKRGLTSEYHDHRKYCLSILQSSIISINRTFNNTIISWDMSQYAQYLKEWKRFATVYEIIAIDASLHQAEAAINDITSLLSIDSLIHPSWGLCLFANGFRAAMDSMRKFTRSLLFSIPRQSLGLFKYDLASFENIILPYAMEALNFVVKYDEETKRNECKYGTAISGLILDMLANMPSDDDVLKTTTSIFNVLVSLKESFDPSRIYVALGMLNGLKDGALSYAVHGTHLVALFDSNCEGFVFETAAQTIYLQLLTKFKLESLGEFLGTLRMFTKFNGTDILLSHYEALDGYLHASGFESSDIFNELKNNGSYSDDKRVLLFPLLQTNKDVVDYITSQDEELFCYLLECNFLDMFMDDSKVKELAQITARHLLLESTTFDLLDAASMSKSKKLFVTGEQDYADALDLVLKELETDDYHAFQLAARRLTLLKTLYCNSDLTVDWERLLKFKTNIVKLSYSKHLKEHVDYYKLLELLQADHLLIIEATLGRKSEVSEDDLRAVLELMNASATTYDLNVRMVSIIKLMLNTGVLSLIEEIVEFLTEMWDNISSTRLKLNEKQLHQLMIEAMVHKSIVDSSSESETISHQLLDFCTSVIENAYGRRSLLPTLSRKLSEYQVWQPAKFSVLEWIPEVLIQAFVLNQLKTNSFKLETVVGDLYDRTFNSTEGLYKTVYGDEEISSRVNLMAILLTSQTQEFSSKVISFIMDNEENYHLLRPLKTTDGGEEYVRIQLMTIILSLIKPLINLNLLDKYFKTFLDMLDTEPSPLVRVYIEWIIALYSNEEQLEAMLAQLIHNASSSKIKPSRLISYQRILLLAIEQLPKEKEESLLTQYITAILPEATSNKVLTRHFSLSLITSIFDEVKEKDLQIENGLKQVLQSIYDTAVQSEAFGLYRSGNALLWNIEKDYNLLSLSGRILLQITDRDDLPNVTETQAETYLTKEQLVALEVPVGNEEKGLWSKPSRAGSKGLETKSSKQTPLQTKSGAWETTVDVDIENSREKQVVRSDLIVVSSLVDKPPNLGGICRLCDVLGAGLLTLHDIRVKNHALFKTVAVTADNWMPMIEVTPDQIRDFILEKKREGYTLIGLEQTDNSIELNSSFQFPKRSLIVLGAEKEGIRGDLLAELDCCLEIKQVGVIRSMNIQTATAIIVHAYSSQHC